MKKIIFLLLLFPLTAISAEKNSLDVETAFKNAVNFGKKDAQYYVVKSYVSGVLNAYSQEKPIVVTTQQDENKIKSYAFSENKPSFTKFLAEDVVFYTTEAQKEELISCIVGQDSDLVMKKIFYKYMDGKIDGKSDFAKEIIDVSELYCKEKLKQPAPISLQAEETVFKVK